MLYVLSVTNQSLLSRRHARARARMRYHCFARARECDTIVLRARECDTIVMKFMVRVYFSVAMLSRKK